MGHGDEHLGAVTSLCFLGDDSALASGCSDSYVRVWDVATRKMVARLNAHEDEVLCVATGPDLSPFLILSGGADGEVRDERETRIKIQFC